MNKTRAARRLACALVAAAIASFTVAGAAFAATVHGTDHHGAGSALESGEIDVLQVDGSAGETVFLTVTANGRAIAKNLPYTIGENASADDGSTWAGIATLDIDGLDLSALDGTYVVQAYASRAGGDLLYQGAIYGVYADLPDGSSKLIGTRTASEAEVAGRTFEPSETLYDNGRTYRLAGDATGSSSLHFPYAEYDEAKTVDGVIKYADATGSTVATTKIPGLAYGEQRSVSVPAVITADNGDLYRTVFFRGSVIAANPGRTSFSILCSKISEADQAQAGYYVATIQMVDQSGNVIASDSVNVTGEFAYTVPSVIYKTEVVDAATGRTAVIAYVLEQPSAVIALSAAKDGVQNRERTVQVRYTAQPLDAAEVAVTFNLLDGSKRVNEEGRMLDVRQEVATESEPTVTPPSQVDFDGVTYHLVGDPSDYAYTLRSGALPAIDAYYVPEGYEAPGAYDVAVNYVNFLTGETIESHSYTTDPYDEARIEIETPQTFSANGVEYVRLTGQEDAIRHSYYSGISAYTVYYRDANDTLSANIVINSVRVTYGDGTASGGDATAGASDAQALQLNAGRTYNVLDGADGNASLTNESGIDSNTERIEDSETPLASGYDKGATSTAASSLTNISGLLAPIGIGAALVIAAAVAVLVVIRRRREDDDYEF